MDEAPRGGSPADKVSPVSEIPEDTELSAADGSPTTELPPKTLDLSLDESSAVTETSPENATKTSESDDTDIKYGNPDIFLCKPSFDVTKFEQQMTKRIPFVNKSPESKAAESNQNDEKVDENSDESKTESMETEGAKKKDGEFKTPDASGVAVITRSGRALRSRAKAASAETSTP